MEQPNDPLMEEQTPTEEQPVEEPVTPEEPETPQLTKEEVENMLNEKTSTLEQQNQELRDEINKYKEDMESLKTPTNEKYLPDDYKPNDLNEFMGKIMETVEQRFPDMAKKQQGQLADSVLEAAREKQSQQQKQQEQEHTEKVNQQIETIQAVDPDFSEKKLYEFLNNYDGDQPKSIPEAYKLYKEQGTTKRKPQIVGAPSNQTGSEVDQNYTYRDMDQAIDEVLADLN